jgi:hypothetical protein
MANPGLSIQRKMLRPHHSAYRIDNANARRTVFLNIAEPDREQSNGVLFNDGDTQMRH